jgi:hypothetical protein
MIQVIVITGRYFNFNLGKNAILILLIQLLLTFFSILILFYLEGYVFFVASILILLISLFYTFKLISKRIDLNYTFDIIKKIK